MANNCPQDAIIISSFFDSTDSSSSNIQSMDGGCATQCEIDCQESCQIICQSCLFSCLGCETMCEIDCQVGCMISCEAGCLVSCQVGCEVICQGCQTGCEVSCQTGCQIACQTGCQVSCQTGCQVSCQDCQTGCEVSVQNIPPNAPVWISPSNNSGWTLNRRPVMRITVSDPNANNLNRIELQFASNIGFSSEVQTLTYDGSWANGATISLVPTIDVNTGLRYARVRARDTFNVFGVYSATRTITIRNEAETWAFPTVNIDPSGNGSLLTWLTEARAAVEHARLFRGLTNSTWVDPTPSAATDARGIHMRELRTRLQEALTVIGVTATYATSTITDDVVDRLGQQWIDLRNNLKLV